MTLNEADKAMLRFLKQQVDRLQDELYSKSPQPKSAASQSDTLGTLP